MSTNVFKCKEYESWVLVPYWEYSLEKRTWLWEQTDDWVWGDGHFCIKDPEIAMMFTLKFTI